VTQSSQVRQAIPESLVVAGIALAQDALAAEVAAALVDGGVSPILLKGASVRCWLYPEGSTTRRSLDVDLLVEPRLFGRAEEILAGLGFRPRVPSRDGRTARHWARESSLFEIDLHNAIVGIGAPPDEAWHVLRSGSEPLADDGRLPALAPDARALVLALHAAKHQDAQAQPLRDLRRGVEVLPEGVWAGASELARRLDAVPALAAGLRLVPEGTALAERLGLPHLTTPDVALLQGRAQGAQALNRLVEIPGLRDKARFAAGRAFPPPAAMRQTEPVARRGTVGLAAAYGLRAWWLLVHAVPAMAAVVSARRQARARGDR